MCCIQEAISAVYQKISRRSGYKAVKNRQANSRMKTKKNIHHSHKNKYPYGAHAAENSGLSQCSVTAIMQRSDSQLLSHMLCLWCQKWTVTNFFDSQFASKSRSTIFLLHNQNLTYSTKGTPVESYHVQCHTYTRSYL